MQSACCSGRNYLRDQLREMEVRTASSGARAYCTTSVLQHHDAVGVRVTRRTPEAAASWPNRRSCVAAAAGMALGPPTTPQLPSSGSRGSQRIWAREIPKRLLLLAFGRLYALFVNMVGRSLLCSHRLRSREGGWMSQGLALTR